MNELTRLHSNQLERAAKLSQVRMTRANATLLGPGNAMYQAQAASGGNPLVVIVDPGPDAEFWKPGMVPGVLPLGND